MNIAKFLVTVFLERLQNDCFCVFFPHTAKLLEFFTCTLLFYDLGLNHLVPLIELGFSLGPVADFSKLSKKSSPENLIKFPENRQRKSLILKSCNFIKKFTTNVPYTSVS